MALEPWRRSDRKRRCPGRGDEPCPLTNTIDIEATRINSCQTECLTYRRAFNREQRDRRVGQATEQAMCAVFMRRLGVGVIRNWNRDLAMPLHVAEIDGEGSSGSFIPGRTERWRHGRPDDRDERDPMHEPIG